MSKIDWDGRVVGYPAEAVSRYRGTGAWGSLPIAAEFRAVAARVPGNQAVAAADGRLTFRELDEQADRLALGLAELGRDRRDQPEDRSRRAPGRGGHRALRPGRLCP